MPHATQPARCRFDARDPTEMRGQTNAAGAIATQPEGGPVGCDQRGLASARAARSSREIVGIVRPAVDQIVAFEGEQQIRQVGPRHWNGASHVQVGD